MDMLTKMNAALDYIEKNLTEEIDFSVVAMKAGRFRICTELHRARRNSRG